MLTLLHNLPEDACVQHGWTKTPEGLPESNPKSFRYRRGSAWTLGNPACFYVMIYDLYGVKSGVANSIAEVYYKMPGKQFRQVANISLDNPDDILGVVRAMQEKYGDGTSEEAMQWKEVMKNLDSDLKNAEANPIEEEYMDIAEDEAQPFIQAVADDWRYSVIDDNTPDELLEAYIRFERSWVAYTSNILLNQYGDIYREELTRSDKIGHVLDKKLHSARNPERGAWLMSLYRLMMPCYIGTYEETEDSNVDYEKKWNKWVAEDIIKENKPIDYLKAQLLIRVREDNKRLPAEMSKYIKNEIPGYLEEERKRLDKVETMTREVLRDEICWLDNYIQWNVQILNPTKEVVLNGNRHLDMIIPYMENEEDLEILTLYSNLLTTCFAESGSRKDRDKFYKRIEDKLKNFVRSTATQPSKAREGSREAIGALVEEFTLGAIYLENLFLQKEGQDIYTYYWCLHQRNLEEKRIEKEGLGFGGFDLWFD